MNNEIKEWVDKYMQSYNEMIAYHISQRAKLGSTYGIKGSHDYDGDDLVITIRVQVDK